MECWSKTGTSTPDIKVLNGQVELNYQSYTPEEVPPLIKALIQGGLSAIAQRLSDHPTPEEMNEALAKYTQSLAACLREPVTEAEAEAVPAAAQ